MSWGTTIKMHVRYEGKVLRDAEDIKKELDSVNKSLKEDWEVIDRYMQAEPLNFVSIHSDSRWDSYDNVLDTLNKKTDCIIRDITEKSKKEAILSVMLYALDDYKGKKDEKFKLHKYGRYNFFTRIVEALFGIDNPEFGTEILVYEYFSREKYNCINDVQNAIEDKKDMIEKFWRIIKHYIFASPKDLVDRPEAETDDDTDVNKSISSVRFMLKQEFDSYKESIEEDLYSVFRLEMALKDWDTANAYFEHIQNKINAEQEFKDKQLEVERSVMEKHGYTPDDWFKAPNWNEINEEVQAELKKLGLDECPVKWDSESDDEE